MKRTLLIVGALMFVSSAAWAQATGTITINGSVDPVLSITYQASALTDATETSTQAANDALAYIMDVGSLTDLSRAATNKIVGGTVTMGLRSNTGGFTLGAGVGGLIPGVQVSGGNTVLELADFGVGIATPYASGTGALVNPAVVGTTTVTAENQNPFAADPFNGANFTTTLAGISGTTIIDGAGLGAISIGGGPTDANNMLMVPMVIGVPIGLWSGFDAGAGPAQGGFTVTVTLTLADA